MTTAARPCLDPADDLTAPAEIDFNAVLAPLLEQRSQSPIVRPTRAEHVEGLLASVLRIGNSLAQ